MGIVNKNTSARGHPILRRYRKHFKILRIFPSIVRYQVLRVLVRNMDPEGFDPVADTVGAGIYGGQIKYSADGKPEIKGPQYGGHNPLPGPVYTGTGYTDLTAAISAGDIDKVKEICSREPERVNELTTGGARPLHMAGMSKNGQLSTKLLIELGGDIFAEDTWGYQPIHRMASNNLAIGLEELLKAGADIRKKTIPLPPFPGGETPLSIAVYSRPLHVVKMLLKYGITKEELAEYGIRFKGTL